MTFKLGLLPRILIAIALGIVCGLFFPEPLTRVFVTFNALFGNFLGFVIPLIIVALITPAISELGRGAGKWLGITAAIARHKEAGLPYLVYLRGPTFGGVLASWGSLGHVTIAEPGALIAFTGPRVVQQTTREKLPEDFGLAEQNLRFGHIDEIVPRPRQREHLARLLRLFA